MHLRKGIAEMNWSRRYSGVTYACKRYDLMLEDISLLCLGNLNHCEIFSLVQRRVKILNIRYWKFYGRVVVWYVIQFLDTGCLAAPFMMNLIKVSSFPSRRAKFSAVASVFIRT